MKKLLVLAVLLLSGCTNSGDAHRALEGMGFTSIEITGYNYFACSKDDFYHTGFTAVNANHQIVNGTVCSGFLFKNSTVRFQ